MREERLIARCRFAMLLLAVALILAALLFQRLPEGVIIALLVVSGTLVMAAACYSSLWRDRRLNHFANDICDIVDALMEGRKPAHFKPYEESAVSKVQEKLLHYYEKMMEEHAESLADKQIIQELVSDISHQVKTPVANIQMFTGILTQHDLPREKALDFLALMAAQTEKLDFLMQSLVKMSRLETGTFELHPVQTRLAETIAQAMNVVWAKAEAKNVGISVACDHALEVWHDSKWTAEALANILDNAVKYTSSGGSIAVTVRPWQFYTRIDITDSGIGIAEDDYHRIFQRFYRGEAVAAEEGVGLGLYLARGIISRQNGYITVKSTLGKGSTFSVFLLSN